MPEFVQLKGFGEGVRVRCGVGEGDLDGVGLGLLDGRGVGYSVMGGSRAKILIIWFFTGLLTVAAATITDTKRKPNEAILSIFLFGGLGRSILLAVFSYYI
jgi:hypothetical protein